jgi:hypothetical protein
MDQVRLGRLRLEKNILCKISSSLLLSKTQEYVGKVVTPTYLFLKLFEGNYIFTC